jgi:hypothetical protein
MTAKKTAKKTTKTKTRKPKPIEVVTKKVLLKIADRIHNPVTGDFLKLCKGTIQNGPDPDMPSRTMHCALGELYYVITGKQPNSLGVYELEIANEIARRANQDENSTFRNKIYKLLCINEDTSTFESRAKKVAKSLREAADCL